MVFLKISQNSQKNTCVKVSCNKVAGLRHRCFPVNFEKFSRIPFFRTPLVAAGHDLKVPIPLCMTFLIFVILSIWYIFVIKNRQYYQNRERLDYLLMLLYLLVHIEARYIDIHTSDFFRRIYLWSYHCLHKKAVSFFWKYTLTALYCLLKLPIAFRGTFGNLRICFCSIWF